MEQREVEERIRRAAWPQPPSHLRDDVLASAVIATAPISWSDRVWFSRRWRLAALGAALGCVVLDQIAASPRLAATPVSEQALAEARVIDETGRQMGLPPDAAAALARRVIAAPARTPWERRSAAALLPDLTQESGGDRE